MKTLLLAVALAGCMQSALAADAASGSFKSEDLAMQVKSTLALQRQVDARQGRRDRARSTSADMGADALSAYCAGASRTS